MCSTNQSKDKQPDELHGLPPVLRAIVSALGFPRAQDWLSAHGGVDVVIPQHRTEALGLEADELSRLRIKLIPHMNALGKVTLPKADKLLTKMRNDQIRKQRPETTIDGLARRYNLTSRHIRNICKPDEDNQLGLF